MKYNRTLVTSAVAMLFAIAATPVVAQEGQAKAHLARGLTLAFQGNYSAAMHALSAAIDAQPNSPTPYYHRGRIAVLLEDYDAAVSDLSRAIELNYPTHEAYGLRAEAYQLKKDLKKAVEDYTVAIRMNRAEQVNAAIGGNVSDNAFDLHTGRGEAYRKLGQYGKALEDFRVHTEAMMHPMYYHLPAFIKATCPEARYRDGDEALELAKMACRASRYELPIHLATLAAAYAETGDFQNAVRWQERAIELLSEEKPAEARARAEYQQRLKFYQARKPYRDSPTN